MSSVNGDDEIEREGDRRTAESNRIGAEGNRIGAETDRVSAEIGRVAESKARSVEDKRIKRNRAHKDWGQLFAYVLIVGVSAVGFRELHLANDRICLSADENRKAITNLVSATETLGRSLITEGKPEEEWTASEKADMADLTKFSDSQEEILETPACGKD